MANGLCVPTMPQTQVHRQLVCTHRKKHEFSRVETCLVHTSAKMDLSVYLVTVRFRWDHCDSHYWQALILEINFTNITPSSLSTVKTGPYKDIQVVRHNFYELMKYNARQILMALSPSLTIERASVKNKDNVIPFCWTSIPVSIFRCWCSGLERENHPHDSRCLIITWTLVAL